MNTWVYIILILLLFGASIYYLTPSKKEIKPTIQYTQQIGPTQQPPYRLDSKPLEIVANG